MKVKKFEKFIKQTRIHGNFNKQKLVRLKTVSTIHATSH